MLGRLYLLLFAEPRHDRLSTVPSQGSSRRHQSDSSSDPPSHLQHPPAAIIEDMNICYILDGILILYGLILTVLYCRLRMVPDNNHPEKQPVKGGIYEGLRTPCADTYETIGKKAIV
ncbi:Fc receptor, IgE, high affinity I, gamma polypeptide like [Pleuronectes platessa]|uniref:Fc receptor, IgE, high affinity I, gamma polypeptide like n=1 Tax=Pleuronectes platessa TaxID=8262 RepID=UPI00232A593F|nr:Fc receptor, IgE, high affinity I, gamma polypeptide like [Pleuronectes platessa]